MLVALAVGASRIYLRAHWLTNVLGGCVLGTSWVAVVIAAMETAAPTKAGYRRARLVA